MGCKKSVNHAWILYSKFIFSQIYLRFYRKSACHLGNFHCNPYGNNPSKILHTSFHKSIVWLKYLARTGDICRNEKHWKLTKFSSYQWKLSLMIFIHHSFNQSLGAKHIFLVNFLNLIITSNCKTRINHWMSCNTRVCPKNITISQGCRAYMWENISFLWVLTIWKSIQNAHNTNFLNIFIIFLHFGYF